MEEKAKKGVHFVPEILKFHRIAHISFFWSRLGSGVGGGGGVIFLVNRGDAKKFGIMWGDAPFRNAKLRTTLNIAS